MEDDVYNGMFIPKGSLVSSHDSLVARRYLGTSLENFRRKHILIMPIPHGIKFHLDNSAVCTRLSSLPFHALHTHGTSSPVWSPPRFSATFGTQLPLGYEEVLALTASLCSFCVSPMTTIPIVTIGIARTCSPSGPGASGHWNTYLFERMVNY